MLEVGEKEVEWVGQRWIWRRRRRWREKIIGSGGTGGSGWGKTVLEVKEEVDERQ